MYCNIGGCGKYRQQHKDSRGIMGTDRQNPGKTMVKRECIQHAIDQGRALYKQCPEGAIGSVESG